MADANMLYEAIMDWGSSFRTNLNGFVTLLQVMVSKRIIDTREAIAILSDHQEACLRGVRTEPQREVVLASFEQARRLLAAE